MESNNNFPKPTPDSEISMTQYRGVVKDLSDKDPQFAEFIEAYQKGEWERSKGLLDGLVSRHPDIELLRDYSKDLEVQLSLRDISLKHTSEQKKQTIKQTARISIFSLALIFFILVIFTGIFILISNKFGAQQKEQDQIQLKSLSAQAGELLLSGQPGPALLVIEKIKQLDPDYEFLKTLTDEASLLGELETKYQSGLELIDAGNYSEALTIFSEIEQARPGLWDVPRQLKNAEDQISIEALFQAARKAYDESDWAAVIENYEAALTINPKLEDGLMKEQLLNGYLRAIIQMLENDSTTIEDIENAEDYYRKAVAMIPQSRAFTSERENLREVSSNLLVLKYSQTASILLTESTQTTNSIGKAVSYLSRASNLSPNDQNLKNELANAQLYQIGLQNFVNMDWGSAIDNLTRLVTADKKYADGKASILLYEAHAARGRQYYSVGLYLDARRNFEAAEIIAWERPDNPFKLFDIQTWLGATLGKVDDYTNAISYYKYAFDSINIYPHLGVNSDFAQLFYSAEAEASAGNNRLAYDKYAEAMTHIADVYTMTEVKVPDGACLAFVADDNKSTISAIQSLNHLSKNVTVTFSQDLQAPTITK
jgi:tetratricopeptide (TPR) repeat protein